MITTAFVHIWGQRVGAIAWEENRRLGFFEYDEKFKQLGWDLAPLTMPIYDGRKVFSFPNLALTVNSPFDTFKGLPGLLADALPDKYGNRLIDIYLAQQGRPPQSMNPVEMLCFLGSRAMGALEFEPARFKQKTSFTIELDNLVELSRHILSERSSFTTDFANEQKAIADILKIGTSAGGARPKAVIAYNRKSGEVRSGQTNAPKGFEHFLIKLDGVSGEQLGASFGFGRVEMAYYLMALDCGIEMMESMLLEENDRAHFMTKRFDRSGAFTRHHVQTWCAMKHVDFNEVNSFSYEQLFQTMRELGLDYQDAEQMYRRMVFNVLARNCDDHTKNFAFILKQNTSWKLAPAYDMCHAYRPDSPWVSQHALSINSKRKNITKEDLQSVAEKMNIKKGLKIIHEVDGAVKSWKTIANKVGVDPLLIDSIGGTHISIN